MFMIINFDCLRSMIRGFFYVFLLTQRTCHEIIHRQRITGFSRISGSFLVINVSENPSTVNADECLMTRLQEMSLDYHFSVEQEVGSSTCSFFGFNGKQIVRSHSIYRHLTARHYFKNVISFLD